MILAPLVKLYRVASFAWKLRRLALPWRDCFALAWDAEGFH